MSDWDTAGRRGYNLKLTGIHLNEPFQISLPSTESSLRRCRIIICVEDEAITVAPSGRQRALQGHRNGPQRRESQFLLFVVTEWDGSENRIKAVCV